MHTKDQKNEDELSEEYLNGLIEQPCQICGCELSLKYIYSIIMYNNIICNIVNI